MMMMMLLLFILLIQFPKTIPIPFFFWSIKKNHSPSIEFFIHLLVVTFTWIRWEPLHCYSDSSITSHLLIQHFDWEGLVYLPSYNTSHDDDLTLDSTFKSSRDDDNCTLFLFDQYRYIHQYIMIQLLKLNNWWKYCLLRPINRNKIT